MSESPLVGGKQEGPSTLQEVSLSPLDVGVVPPPADAIRSVYVHAPFCPRRCIYCDFAVTVAQEGNLDGWLKALEVELRMVSDQGLFPLASSLKTLFVGGGTPSFLGPAAMDGLAGVLGRDRLTEPSLEWTVEANPESFTAETARAWSRTGVNRISLGAQTFHDPTLRWMGRLHSGGESERAVNRAREAGIENISLDLIFGLPEGSSAGLEQGPGFRAGPGGTSSESLRTVRRKGNSSGNRCGGGTRFPGFRRQVWG